MRGGWLSRRGEPRCHWQGKQSSKNDTYCCFIVLLCAHNSRHNDRRKTPVDTLKDSLAMKFWFLSYTASPRWQQLSARAFADHLNPAAHHSQMPPGASLVIFFSFKSCLTVLRLQWTFPLLTSEDSSTLKHCALHGIFRACLCIGASLIRFYSIFRFFFFRKCGAFYTLTIR